MRIPEPPDQTEWYGENICEYFQSFYISYTTALLPQDNCEKSLFFGRGITSQRTIDANDQFTLGAIYHAKAKKRVEKVGGG